MIQLKNKIKTALHDSPFVRVICRTIKWIRKYQESAFMFIVWLALILMLTAFVGLMSDATIFNWDIPTLLYDWLGTKEDKAKHETLKFIGFGIGGVLATIGAVAFNRRATAQIEASKAQTQHNELIEKENDNKRFQNLINDLGHGQVTVRITTFYRFYYMAKKEQKSPEQTNQFRKDVFEILCAYLRIISNVTPDSAKENEHQMERQTLFDILFKEKFKNKHNSIMDNDFSADLRNIYFDKMDLSDANLSRANLSLANLLKANLFGADLSGAKLTRTNLSGANLTGARLLRARLSDTNLSDARLLGANLSGSLLFHTNLSGANLFGANLSKTSSTRANLSNVNLFGANLSGAGLRNAQLKGVDLMKVHSIEKVDFRSAKIGDRPITKDDLPTDKGEYYANWNPPPEKEEN